MGRFWAWLAEFLGWTHQLDTIETIPIVDPIPEPQNTPVTPSLPPKAPSMPPDPDLVVYPWDSPQHNYHNTRVLCDQAGLTVDEKNLICACLYQESRFLNSAVNYNKNSAGHILSTDYGIAQINDFYHIGQNKDFPSIAYVEQYPDKVVSWMIGMYKRGLLKQWVSYSSGAFLTWLKPNSPMWKLGVNK